MAKRDKEQVYKNRQTDERRAINEREIAKPSRKPGKKRFGLVTTHKYRDHKGGVREYKWTHWYETDRDRENAFRQLRKKWPYYELVKERVER